MTLPDPLVVFADRQWPGRWFVRDAAPSGRLAVLYAVSLGAHAGHDYIGCEHLVAGSIRSGGLRDAGNLAGLRQVAVAAVASSRTLAECEPERVREWFADDTADDPARALAGIRILPTVTPQADRALRRARSQAWGAASIEGPGAVHVLSGVLADPGTVGPAASSEGVSLDGPRLEAERRAGWGPLLDLLED